MNNATSFLGRYWRVILFILALLLTFWILWKLLIVLLPFLIGLILTYLLMPPINWVEKRLPGRSRWAGFKRVTIILLIYLAVISIIVAIGFFTIPAIVNSITEFFNNLPTLIPQVITALQDFTNSIRQHIPSQIQSQVNTYLSNLGTTAGDAVKNGLLAGVSFIASSFGLVVGFASIPIFLFFLLKDAEKLSEGFYSPMPPWLREHTKGIVQILRDILGRYIRSAIILGIFVGLLDFIGLMILGVPFAPALAFWAGLTELIPVLGPWLGAVPAVIVALATEPNKLIWVGVLYFLVQNIEGNLLVPRIHGQFLRLHPAVILILLVVGGHFGGLWGIILIVPGAATLVQIYKYLIITIKAEGQAEKYIEK